MNIFSGIKGKFYMTKNNNKDITNFQVQLLARLIDINKYPLTKMIIEKNITQEEYTELFQLLQRLEIEYELQKEEGLMDFTSLLVQFAGMLNKKLEPNTTIHAMKKEGYFPDLLKEFVKLLKEGIDLQNY